MPGQISTAQSSIEAPTENSCSPILIESLDDPRVEPYRNLKMKNLQRGGEFFIAEGKKVVERMLQSNFQAASVFISKKRLEEWTAKVPPGVPLYVASQDVMNGLVGFDFHVGVVGCGIRKSRIPLDQVVSNLKDCLTVVACPNCDNPENLGAIIRIGAAFGIDALLLGKSCCDPFSRRVIRVSMGAAFTLPIVESADLYTDLQRLKSEWQFQLSAAVLDDNAIHLDRALRTSRFGILLGNEDTGLDQSWVNICDQKLTIPMCLGTDSLNVAVTAGIILHHFTRSSLNPTSPSEVVLGPLPSHIPLRQMAES
jgi:tRNA G18 (ribose-2'-O)-methylase SpoU